MTEDEQNAAAIAKLAATVESALLAVLANLRGSVADMIGTHMDGHEAEARWFTTGYLEALDDVESLMRAVLA